MAPPVATRLIEEHLADQDKLGNHIALLDYMSNIAHMDRNHRRQEAQVDAILTHKYGECYEPPEEEMANIILNSIITDEETISKLTSKKEGEGGIPQAQPLPRPKKNSMWPIVAAMVGVGAAAGLPGWMALMNQPKDTNTDTQIVVTPGDVSQIETGN